MEIIGIITQIVDKNNPPFKKKIIIIADVMNEKNIWGIECRKALAKTVKHLRIGDYIKVEAYVNCKLDRRNNHYNNVIAEEVERL